MHRAEKIVNTTDRIRKITIVGLLGNVVLSILKLVIGYYGASQAVIADALHSFSDTLSDLVILFGVKYWTAPPDQEHPFGHQKIESFIAIFIGLILVAAALGMGWQAIESLMAGKRPSLTWIALAAPLLSLVVKELLFRITWAVGVQAGSSALKANAWHHRTDALSSIPVLAAVAACLIDPRLAFLDAVGAIVVSIFIIKVGAGILFSNINDLLDRGLAPERIRAIEQTIRAIDQVKGVHRVRTRKLASHVYVDLHLEVDGTMSVVRGHEVSEQVKQVLLKAYPRIIDVMVHLEPAQDSPGRNHPGTP